MHTNRSSVVLFVVCVRVCVCVCHCYSHRELGAILSGKLRPTAPTQHNPISSPAHTDTAAATAAYLASQDTEDQSLLALWQDYATSADGPSMTALRVSLIGKVSHTKAYTTCMGRP